MSLKFFPTNNRKWFAVSPPPCKKGSERMTIYEAVAAHPGISTEALLRLLPPQMKPPRSRLAELQHGGYLRSEFKEDLFQ